MSISWKIGKRSLALILVVFCLPGLRLDPDSGIPRNLDVYLVIGQSNMAGRAPAEGSELDTLRGVFLFTGDSSHLWIPATNPLNKYSTIRKDLKEQKMGPAYHFARLLHDVSPYQPIGLVVNCRGGTSIDQWMPGTPYFSEAVSRARAAGRYGTIKGIIWHQGESDVNNCSSYLDKLSKLINALRKELGNPEIPFIAGQLSEDKKTRAAFNSILARLPETVENTAVVSAEGLSTFDSTHFDTRSIRILGERYGEAMLRNAFHIPGWKIRRKMQFD